VRNCRSVGTYSDVVEAFAPEDDGKRIIKLGLRSETLRQYVIRDLRTPIAEYYGIVQDDVPFAQHAFLGLNRPLLDEEDVEAGQEVVVYSWRPVAGYVWSGSRFDGMPVSVKPPPGKVFVVLARLRPPDQNGIEGQILRWNWIREDQKLAKAPVDWEKRYGTKLWSR
jgi:hypothetical protein